MTAARRPLAWAALAGVLVATAGEAADATVRVSVPAEVAAQAARRAAGDATAAPPVLVHDGMEIGEGEGLTIRVRGPADPGSSAKGPILAVTGMVGRAQRSPKPPLRKVTLTVPLNERGMALLAGRGEVTLTLEVTNNPGRAPLAVERAFLDVPRE
jgi:hypothetical protein